MAKVCNAQGFLKVFYGVAVYLMILEAFYPFEQSFLPSSADSHFTKIMKGQTEWLAEYFELWSFYTLMVYATWLVIKYAICKPIGAVVFYYRPNIREAIRELKRKRLEERKAKGYVEPTLCQRVAYIVFLPLMAINGAVFNRAEGSPVIQGAVEQYTALMVENLPIYAIELVFFLIFFVVVFIFAAVRAAIKAKRTAANGGTEEERTPLALEAGQETMEVKAGIYTTATTYITTSVFDEKLVDIEEEVTAPATQ